MGLGAYPLCFFGLLLPIPWGKREISKEKPEVNDKQAGDVLIEQVLPELFPLFFPNGASGFTLQKLAGDASDRRYYRVTILVNHQQTSFVVMQLPESFSESEELPFLNIHAHLTAIDLPVPQVLATHPSSGLILLEDLGDTTLEKHLQEVDEGTRELLYRQALDLLLPLQIEGSKPGPRRCVAFQLAFDEAKLLWELDFFLHSMIERLLKKTIKNRDRQDFHKAFLHLITPLVREKRYFTHRDYHSRNLMVRDGKLFIIDFQDARMGLCQYDLASLLRDSYYALSPPLLQSLLCYYIDQKEEREGGKIFRDHFRYIFDLMAIQRNLKALGTFAFQAVEKQRSFYLDYVPRTLQYVKENLARYAELATLQHLLHCYLFDEFRTPRLKADLIKERDYGSTLNRD